MAAQSPRTINNTTAGGEETAPKLIYELGGNENWWTECGECEGSDLDSSFGGSDCACGCSVGFADNSWDTDIEGEHAQYTENEHLGG